MYRLLKYAMIPLVFAGSSSSLHAQPYVTVPDPVFRAYIDSIVPGAIVGNDLNTSHPGLPGIQFMDLMWKGISNITGVQYFTNLQYLYCSYNSISFLPPLPPGLVDLYCNDNLLSSLPALPSGLQYLVCANNLFSTFSSLPGNLYELSCGNNLALTSLPALPQSLIILWADGCSLTSLPALPPNLSHLGCGNNLLTALPALPNSLNFLGASGNPNLWCLPNIPTNQNFYSDIGTLVCMPQGTPDAWYKLSDNPASARELALSIGIGDKCYLGMGTNFNYTNDWWEFDPATNAWTQKASLPGPARLQPTGFDVGNRGYVGLGQGNNPTYLYDFWEYNPATNAWKQMANYPGTGCFGNAAFSIGDKGYVGSGWAPGYLFPLELYAFDPAADTWTQKSGFPWPGRTQAACFAIGNKGYVCGGDWANGLTATSFCYDPAADAWSAIASFPDNVNEAAAFGVNGKGFVACGQYGWWNGTLTNWLYEYDPATNGWAKRADLPTRGRCRTTGCAAGGRGYVGTGLIYTATGGYTKANDWWEYTPPCSSPSNLIYASGNTTFCSGDSVMLFADPGNSYQWKKNGASINGAAFYFHYVKSVGTYTCAISNACGSVASVPIDVTVKSLPSAGITTSGPTTFCAGGSVVLQTVFNNNRIYQWYRNGAPVSGAVSDSYTADHSGKYKVKVTNTVTGCSKITGTNTVVTKLANPSATITPSGTVTFCAGQSALLTANAGTGFTYYWKKDGIVIPGATMQSYLVTAAGNYKVVVTKANGCSKTSKADTVVVPCRNGMDFGESASGSPSLDDVTIIPNPFGDRFTVTGLRASGEEISISVIDVAGRLQFTTRTSEPVPEIILPHLAPGMYLVHLRSIFNEKKSGL